MELKDKEIGKIYETKEYVESCFEIAEDNVVYVFDENSTDYRQYKKECQDKKHKEDRERRKRNEEYNENILYCIEYDRKKKEHDEDIVDRDRLGFDEDSFKGEPYHGQKRKNTVDAVAASLILEGYLAFRGR